jgi:hypothetical protein
MAATSLIVASTSNAQGDVQIKSKLLGYWMSPRHGYLIQANGLMRMRPTVGPNHATMTNRWDVRNGMFYQDGEPYKIVKFTQSEFDYEAVRESGVQVHGKFVVTCPVGTVFPLYRATRAMAEQQPAIYQEPQRRTEIDFNRLVPNPEPQSGQSSFDSRTA